MVEEAKHGLPVEEQECMCCYDDVDESNYVEYQPRPGAPWLPSKYCTGCLEHLQSTQFKTYVDQLAKTTCKAEQRRLLDAGPPINLRDKHALPVGDDEYGEVHQLWYMSDRQVHSAKLEGSLEGEERQQWWDEQRQFKIKDEPDDPHDPNAPSTEETVAATEEQTRTQPATAPTPTAEVVAAAEEMDIGKDMDGEAPAGP